jgi:tetratricopeptide (TPR) repeat protein
MMKFNKESIFERSLLVLFGTGLLIFFGFFYNQHLFQREQLQLFEFTFQYFIAKISCHGGFTDWFGEFFIQFFCLPFTGAIIISILAFLIWLLIKRILSMVSRQPAAIIFTFLPAAGYSILLLDDYYSLSGLTGLLLSLCAALFYIKISDSRLRILTGLLLIPMTYWLAGASFMVFVLIIIVYEILCRTEKGNSAVPAWALFLYMLIAIVLPLASRQFIFKDTLLQAFISESYYKIRIFFPLPLVLIFISVPLFMVIQYWLVPLISKKHIGIFNGISLFLLLILMIFGIHKKGDFEAEKRMAYENLVYREDWKQIISKAEKENPYDQNSMIAVNLALAKTGELSSKMFLFNQAKEYLFPDYSNRGMTPFISSDVYYQLGLYNFAQMFALETIESTIDVKYPSRSFRRAAETYFLNGQYDIAGKYLKPLSNTIFYRKWAKECLSLSGNEVKINSHPYWGNMRKLSSKYDFYFNINQADIPLKYLLISNPGNKTAYEYLMEGF